jgi:hypothetical protein
MRWDRKIFVFAAAATVLIAALAVFLILITGHRVTTAAERIEGTSQEGFLDMTERIARRESDVFKVSVSRRGKFELQVRYRDFDTAWLRELEYVPSEFLFDEVDYSYKIEFRLKSYDTENVYSHKDSWVAYTRIDDGAAMLKSGDLYYIHYRTGDTDYYFAAKCPPMTAWLNSFRD